MQVYNCVSSCITSLLQIDVISNTSCVAMATMLIVLHVIDQQPMIHSVAPSKDVYAAGMSLTSFCDSG